MNFFLIFFIAYVVVMVALFGFLMWRGSRRRPVLTLPIAPDSRKYCRDCAFCVPAPSGMLDRRRNYDLARCAHITSVREPAEILVTGQLAEPNMSLCSSARRAPYTLTGITLQFLPPSESSDGASLCGPDGRYWEARP